MTYIGGYLFSFLTFILIDSIWLKFIANGFFKNQIGHLMKDHISITLAICFYLIYAIGIVLFALKPAFDNSSLKLAVIYGALFGLFCYGTFDMTNYIILKNWPLRVVVVDVIWGTSLTALSAVIGYWGMVYFKS